MLTKKEIHIPMGGKRKVGAAVRSVKISTQVDFRTSDRNSKCAEMLLYFPYEIFFRLAGQYIRTALEMLYKHFDHHGMRCKKAFTAIIAFFQL